MDGVVHRAARLAPTQVPLLLVGETGTGKEYLARAIHVTAPGARAFHALRCAGLRPDSIDALRAAPAGTVFLRGLEDLTPAAQGALLALIDDRDDLRWVASAQRDISEDPGDLRDDLLYRLTGATLALPPLRMRHDVGWMLDRLLRRRAPDGCRLSPAARIDLTGRPWPGNIREMARTLDVAIALAEGLVIDLPDLPPAPSPGMPSHGESPDGDDLEALLTACQWNMSQVARRLGVNRSTVMRRVRKAGLVPPSTG